jgi:hypothetical protein
MSETPQALDAYYSDDQTVRAAFDAREKLGFSRSGPINNWFLDEDKIKIAFELNDVVIDDFGLSQNRFAEYDGNRRILIVSQIAAGLIEEGNREGRFSLAHELGHIVLEHTGVHAYATGMAGDVDRSLTTRSHNEKTADRLAAHFLVPYPDIPVWVKPDEIAKVYGVPQKQAENHIHEVHGAIGYVSRGNKRPESVVETWNRSLQNLPSQGAAPSEPLRTMTNKNQLDILTRPDAHSAKLLGSVARNCGFTDRACKTCGSWTIMHGQCLSCDALD